MHKISKEFKFCAAHRLINHGGKCRHLHGHNYTAVVSVMNTRPLDDSGMVVDFGRLKELIGKWIDDNWDHNVILNPGDPLAALYRDRQNLSALGVAPDRMFTREPFFMPPGWEPTAERMAEALFKECCVLFKDEPVAVECVEVYETDSCSGGYSSFPKALKGKS